MPPLRRSMRRTARRTSRRTARRQSDATGGNQQNEPVQTAPADSGGDYTQELEKLAELKDKGVITEEEFQAKKKQLLG